MSFSGDKLRSSKKCIWLSEFMAGLDYFFLNILAQIDVISQASNICLLWKVGSLSKIVSLIMSDCEVIFLN